MRSKFIQLLRCDLQAMLRRIGSRDARRALSNAPLLQNKTVIPSVILDKLRDTSNLVNPSTTPSAHKKKQIFLKPEEFRDRRLNRYVEDIEKSSNVRSTSMNSNHGNPLDILGADLIENNQATVDSLTKSIDIFKPLSSEISKTKYGKIKQDLINSFTHSQLSKYLNDKYKDPKFTQYKRSNRGTKSALVGRIMDNIWEVQRSNKLTAMDDLLTRRSFKLSKSELFLLLLENGFIIQYLGRVGVKINFDPSEDKISFVGTSSQVMNAEIILNSILNKSHKEMLDLSNIKELFLSTQGEFSLVNLGRNTEVFFNHLQDDNYELVTLNSNQIKRSKRLLLWLLNYNEHTKEHLVLPENVALLDFLPYKDDDSLAWNNRYKSLFVLKDKDTQANGTNPSFISDLQRFSDKSLSKERLAYENEVNDAKSLPLESADTQRGLNQESWKLLGDLGILNIEEPNQTVAESLPKSGAVGSDTSPADLVLTPAQIDKIYSQLTDFSYRGELKGLSDSKLNSPILTVTIGNILYEGEESQTLLDKKPTMQSLKQKDVKFRFNTNVPLANDSVLSLPVFEYPELSVKDINHFLHKDPHSYVVQMKFLPSPFHDKQGDTFDVHEQMKYPQVEIWVDLNERSKPDLDTLNIVTVEGENNCYVSLPHLKSDMKICCQLSGDLLREESEESTSEPAPESLAIEDILNSTTSRYSRFKLQPGIDKFLQEAKLDFSGKVPTSIPSTIELNIDGEPVTYHYINMSYRRQLNFSFGTDQHNNERLVQFNILEGGSLGGRKLEINFVGDLSSIDKQVFENLLKDTVKFINEL